MTHQARPTILIVDDSAENLHVMSGLLQSDYRVLAATTGERCLELARSHPAPDLILLDIMMPGLDGYQTLERLRAEPATREIPVIFVTAMGGSEAQLHGLAVGAVDYITKPIDPPLVLARVKTQIELKQARDWLKDKNAWLEAEIAQRLAENETIQIISIRALAHLAEIRDPETGNHIHRTQNYVCALAHRLREHPRFADFLTERNIDLLVKSAPLHDIGKVGVPDQILLKPGPLTAEEWEVMKTHAKLGSDAIELAEGDAEQTVAFLTLAKEIAHWHHEKWDGSGYPDGLAGESIPIAARLMALADVFDALISARPYKPAMGFDKAREIIVAGCGHHFDPDMTNAFVEIFDECVAIALHYRDQDEP
ncbi:MAG: two-component system response regulator [Pseudomonadota bacterium]